MRILLLIILALGFTLARAQDCPCCTEAHQYFNFWVGEWNVYDTMGTQVGQSSITQIEDGCAIIEHWTGAKGYTGSSMNYYDKTDSTWNQVWMDKNGDVLNLKGGFVAGKMILKSDTTVGSKGNIYYNQITWYKDADNQVVQLWEVYAPNGVKLQQLFKGIYKPKKSSH